MCQCAQAGSFFVVQTSSLHQVKDLNLMCFELVMSFHHINDVGESVQVTQFSTHETVNSVKTDYITKIFTIILSFNHSGFHPDFSCSAIPHQFYWEFSHSSSNWSVVA